jgi:hypothetical protein
MDQCNHFESRTTYYLHRAEYLLGLAVSLYLLIEHWESINGWHFFILFSYIDLIGYIPGAIAFRVLKNKNLPRFYFVLYNSTHSLVSAALVAFIWSLFFGVTWSLLAIPIHLCGDRAIFGNFLKSFCLSFEPKEHPAFSLFKSQIGIR